MTEAEIIERLKITPEELEAAKNCPVPVVDGVKSFAEFVDFADPRGGILIKSTDGKASIRLHEGKIYVEGEVTLRERK